MSLSSTLIPGQRRETGLYDPDSSASFPGLRRGMITLLFQMVGIVLVATEILKISVRFVGLHISRYLSGLL